MDKKTLDFSVHAPGKVLITGGYLILSPENEGVVLATDAYFHCDVSFKDESGGFILNCPQIGYRAKFDEEFKKTEGNGENCFVEKCFQTFYSIYGKSSCQNLAEMTLYGDLSFYS